MKSVKIVLLAVVTALMVSWGTTRVVPISGRTQTLLVNDEQVLSLSNQEYSNFMKSAKVSTNSANTAMVKRVGQRLASAVENYLKSNGLSSEVI